MTKIWYRHTLLYPPFEFDVYFSKIFVTVLFGQIWSHNLDLFKLTEISQIGTWHFCMLIKVLMFIFSTFMSFIFLGQIWFQDLQFSKLTEIWHMSTLWSAYYDFNVYFFKKKFVSHICLGKFGLKIWSSPNWLKFGAGLHHYTLITISMFIFSKVLSFIVFGQIWKISKYYGPILFHLVFYILMKLHCISMLNFSKYGEQQVLEWNFPKKFMHRNYFEKLHIKTIISIEQCALVPHVSQYGEH